MIAHVGQTARLGDSTIREKVGVNDGGADAEAANGVATVGVDRFNVDAIAAVQTVTVEVP